jgi:predicted secreted protein
MDCYTFSASGGEVVNIDLSQNSAAGEAWEIYDPDALRVNPPGACTAGYCNVTLPAKSGTYTIQVFDVGSDQTFSYNVTLQGLSDDFTCGDPLVCDQTVSGSTVVGDTDTYTFAGIANEVVNIDLSQNSAAGELWQIYDPDGLLVVNFCVGGYCNGTLPAKSGTYTIIVVDGNSDQPIPAYNLTLQGLSDGFTCGDPLVCGQTVSGSTVVGDTDTYTFAGIANEAVNIDLSQNSAAGEVWRLHDPDGLLIVDFCTSGYCDGTLPAKSGTYTIIVVDGNSDQPIPAYNLTLQGVSEGDTCGEGIVCGETVAAPIDVPGDTDSYSFFSEAGDTFNITIADTCSGPFEPVWQLYNPDGGRVGGFCGGSCNVTLPLSGTYTLIAVDSDSDEAGIYSVTVNGTSVPFTCNPPPRCPVGVDEDGDGVCDTEDNCVPATLQAEEIARARNPNQRDTNLDGFGNACDADYDNGGVVGGPDFNRLRSGFGASICDASYDPDVDAKGDGFIGGPDFSFLRLEFGGAPGPSGLPCAGTIPCP